MQNLAVIILLLICLVVLLTLFRISYKILIKVRHEERANNAGKLKEYRLHPKLEEQNIEKEKQKK